MSEQTKQTSAKLLKDMDIIRCKALAAEKKYNDLLEQYNGLLERLQRSEDKLTNTRFEVKAEKRVNQVLLEVLRLGGGRQEAEEQ
jgi:hypothetical protein